MIAVATTATCPPATNVALVIDDEEDFRILFSVALRRAGYEVVAVEHGAQGLATLENAATPPSIVFCDLQVPTIDGAAFAARLRTQAGWRDVPLVLCSVSPEVPSIARRIGADGYIEKGSPRLIHDISTVLRRIAGDRAMDA